MYAIRSYYDPIISLIDFEAIYSTQIPQELNLSIKALCLKIAAFGLDNDINHKFRLLNLESGAFETLISQMVELESYDTLKTKELITILDRIENNILSLRRFKSIIGVNLHLTIVTRRILEYIQRVKELLDLKLNINSETHWREILNKHSRYCKEKDSLRAFIVRHFDLLIFEAVEHTSNKGEKYIAETRITSYNVCYTKLLRISPGIPILIEPSLTTATLMA